MRPKRRITTVLAGMTIGWILCVSSAWADLDISDTPLFLPGAVPPLNMLVMGRDHTLYYEAYNDASDLDGDGTPDVGYKPGQIDYYGYFDSYKCYTYDSSQNRFNPSSTTADKTCSGNWSGDFLNYLTTSRMDALRKVLYGGRRSTDTDSLTVLQRSYIPQDAHSWGKEYQSVARDGYDISDYTPYSIPNSNTRHLFANVSLNSDTSRPLLRVLLNRSERIWEWVSKERPVAGNNTILSSSVSPTNFRVRVQVCNSSMIETNCQPYPDGNYKPIGLLQDFGEGDEMLFGLLSGSYQSNTRGGVLRSNIRSISDEIDPAYGAILSGGIIDALDRFRIAEFTGSNYSYAPGNDGSAWIATRPITNGEIKDWGNPIAEMMYETLRYFADKGVGTSQFGIASSGTVDAALGLSVASWEQPFNENPVCSAPVQTVISGIYPSYDTEYVPGSAFSSFSGDVTGLNASSLGDTIWNEEYGGSSSHFIGQVGTLYDGAPTAKTVSSFGNIRGLAPEEPTKQGGYYAASTAYFGRINDLSPADGDQMLRTYAVALASPLPRIEIPVAGQIVTLVPFGKSVNNFGISSAQGDFQPTNTIVDFYVETIANTSAADADPLVNDGLPYGKFRINFEDVEQGADHDMDAIVSYEFRVLLDNTISVTLNSEYAAGSIEQHLGYVISGTTADGIYLEVRDCDTANSSGVGTCSGNNPSSVTDYFLDTPPTVMPGACAASPMPAACAVDLPLTATRVFTPSGNSGATLLKDPLWYAAKWGGFEDLNGNGLPDLTEEWDEDADGVPDNYFLVTNALTLNDQLRNAFNQILSTTSSASSVATNSTRLDTETLIYQARFRSDDWTGQLIAYALELDGSLGTVRWDAADLVPNHSSRNILSRDGAVPGAAGGIDFLWGDLSATQQAALNQTPSGTADTLGDERLDWLRGDQSTELSQGGTFRNRSSTLGDIINSDPQFVGAPNFGYEALPSGTPGQATYQAYLQSKLDTNGSTLKPMIYVGANDGMLHGFDAETGVERFAYVPSTLIPELNELMQNNYVHRYYVDGHVFVGDAYIDRGGDRWASVLVGTTGAGGRTVYALDVTDPHSTGPSDVMWEFTDPDLGATIGQPIVARMADGTWVAVFGNGYNSDNHRAVLFIVDLETGTLLKKIDTGVGSVGTPNGLATPSLLADGTRTIRTIFAGDLHGNLWEFDVSSTNVSTWDSEYKAGSAPEPLFTATDGAGNPQPITSPVEIGRHPNGGYMLYFGTGKYFETNDNIVGVSPQIQTFYGIWEKTGVAQPITYASRDTVLQEQEIVFEGTPSGSSFEVRVTTNDPVDWVNKRGWYLDLESPNNGPEGERVVASPILRGGRIIFPTLIPSPNPCEFGGSSWIMELDAVSGSRLIDSPLDINEDGEIDSGDFVTVDLPDGTTVNVPVSGVRSREGIVRTPAVISAGEDEFKLASGTSGNVEVLREQGLFDRARASWRQLR
ncbi:MAG TPA: PilC/PilY family type IV pilus protein [Gammaproteobacteria bacterium]|nr:PilC/PilY family type IV pilus protein [Gammaproteobacteria bacterium]